METAGRQCFVSVQNNTTLKPSSVISGTATCFVSVQNNTTLKLVWFIDKAI